MDVDGLTRDLCNMVMANLWGGKGGIVLFEWQMHHLVPIHSGEYTVSNYLVC